MNIVKYIYSYEHICLVPEMHLKWNDNGIQAILQEGCFQQGTTYIKLTFCHILALSGIR